MQTLSKSQVWTDLQKRFHRTVDRLGERIDPGIMDTVVAFNAAGLYTSASCEGHLDHGLAHPWIDVTHEEAEDIAQKIVELLNEGKREDAYTQQLMKEHRQLLLQAEQGLVELLNAFYQHHTFDYDRHLIVWRFSNGKPRLQSHGAEYQPYRDPAKKAQKLKEYQDEMQCFASFLKERFFATQ
jgi:hypothetical protein